MTALPPSATKTHLDQDSDDIYQARAELAAHTDQINTIISYLAGLFGSDGVKLTAMATLGTGFPAGTVMAFIQPTVPIGWQNIPQAENFYLVCGNNGGNPYGSFGFIPYTSSTVLAQGNLPAINLTGTTSVIGEHRHIESFTGIQSPNPGLSSVRVAQGDSYYVWNQAVNGYFGGAHAHSITLSLGGQNWGHNHYVDFSNYRPRALQVLLGAKT